MKTTERTTRLARLALGLLVALSVACKASPAVRSSHGLDQTILGTAQAFAVLAGSTVTNTGATTVEGDLGVNPGLAVTGFPPGLVTFGSIHAGDATSLAAENDATKAYDTLAAAASTADLTGQDLGGKTLTAGVYTFSSSAQLTGALTLDAADDPGAVFVFQIGTTLTTASGSSVLVIHGGNDCNVFWQVGSSATIGTTTAFKGSIVALTSIALQTGATVSGRALARNAAVTLDTNAISTSACSGPADAGMDAGTPHDGGPADALVDMGGPGTDVGAKDGGAAPDAAGGGGDASAGDAATGDAGTSDGAVDSGGVCCHGVLCGSSCTDTSGDVKNCGACGNACSPADFCAGGVCLPCGSVCGGICTDLGSDDANCGTCGHACLPSEACGSGACVTCGSLCGGACADLGGDDANCGSCGHSCAASESCASGVCVLCPGLCGGACTDLQGDPSNCGSCGNACSSGDSCIGGGCVCL